MNNQPFLLNPAYQDFIPGKTPLQFESLSEMKAEGCGCMGLLLFGFWFPTCLLMMCLMGYGVIEDMLYARTGHEITVTATNCRMVSGKNSDSPAVTYTYSVDGMMYTGSRLLYGYNAGDCSRYPEGQTLKALYLEPDPTQSRIIEDVATRGAFDLVGIFIAVFMLVIGVFVLYDLCRYVRARWIYPRFGAKSVLLDGEIISIKGEWRNKHSYYYVVVKYAFESPRKRECYGKTDFRRDDLVNQPLPPIGTPVTILYADDNAHIML